ncbi:hypothetical protein JTB14_031561 [Gonioctena quinquepunctata]|nr:hypothetical protein JTB14_031561 [Gonioctena quinquepunctata]
MLARMRCWVDLLVIITIVGTVEEQIIVFVCDECVLESFRWYIIQSSNRQFKHAGKSIVDPTIRFSIFGNNFVSLLDSGATHSIIGSDELENILKSLQIKLNSSKLKYVIIAETTSKGVCRSPDN